MTDVHTDVVEPVHVEPEPTEPIEPAPPIDPVEPENLPAVPEWTADEEAEAKMFGWKAPDEWAGEKPPGYIDNPKRYMERAEASGPFRKMREREAALQHRLEKIENVSQRALERQRMQFERQLSDINAQKRAAVELGDTEAYDKLEKQASDIVSLAREPAAPPPQAEPSPVVAEYVQKNEWAKNPLIWDTAIKLVDSNPAMQMATPEQQLAYAEGEVRKMYPAYFEKPIDMIPAPARVTAGGLGAPAKSGFAKLPQEAQAAFSRFVAEGLFEDNEKGRKEFLDDYES